MIDINVNSIVIDILHVMYLNHIGALTKRPLKQMFSKF